MEFQLQLGSTNSGNRGSPCIPLSVPALSNRRDCLEFQERRDKGGDNAAFPPFWGEKQGLGQGVGILLLPGLSPVVPACHRDPSPARDWEWLPGERPEREMEAWDVPEGPRAGGEGRADFPAGNWKNLAGLGTRDFPAGLLVPTGPCPQGCPRGHSRIPNVSRPP